jgi:AmmeMemoRadiSam system protein B
VNEPLRKAVIAGSWYSGRPAELRAQIDLFFDRVPPQQIPGEVVGLIAPHAGYAYSGEVAACAYKLIRGGTYDAVIVVGPSHRASFRGVSEFNRGGYETPLGIVPVHAELADGIAAQSSVVSVLLDAHMQEQNAIEIQLPFLQRALGRFRFVPLIMADQSADTCEKLAEAIVLAAGRQKILFVASSDLSHDYAYDQAVQMDGIALRHMENMDANGLLTELAKGTTEACGGGPAAVVMMAARKLGADRAKILKYANSGDVVGDRRSRIVGYASVAFFRSLPAGDVSQ